MQSTLNSSANKSPLAKVFTEEKIAVGCLDEIGLEPFAFETDAHSGEPIIDFDEASPSSSGGLYVFIFADSPPPDTKTNSIRVDITCSVARNA